MDPFCLCSILIFNFIVGDAICSFLCSCRLADLKDFKKVNEIYAKCEFYGDITLMPKIEFLICGMQNMYIAQGLPTLQVMFHLSAKTIRVSWYSWDFHYVLQKRDLDRMQLTLTLQFWMLYSKSPPLHIYD